MSKRRSSIKSEYYSNSIEENRYVKSVSYTHLDVYKRQPFTRKQIMAYLTLQTIVQSVMIGFFALIFFVGMSSGLSFEPMFVWLLIIGVIFTILIFLVLSDYLYVLSIGDKKYNILSKVIIGIFVFIVMMTLIMTYLQTGELKTLFIDFIQSPLFYFVPVFGWLKLGLISYVTKEYLRCV